MRKAVIHGLVGIATLWSTAAFAFGEKGQSVRKQCLSGDTFKNSEVVAGQCLRASMMLPQAKKTDAGIYVQLGYAFYWMGDYRKAIPQFEKAIDLDPDMNDARIELAWSHLRLDETEAANSLFNEAEKREPRNARVAFARGFLADAAQDYPAAIKAYNTALEYDPGYLLVHHNLASIYRSVYGDSEKTIAQYDMILSVGPAKANLTKSRSVGRGDGLESFYDSTLLAKGEALVYFHRQPEAVVIFEDLKKRYPGNRLIERELALANLNQDKYDEGVKQIDAANAGLIGCNCQNVAKLQALFFMHKEDEALQLANAILAKGEVTFSKEELGETHFYRAVVERHKGNRASAYADLQAVLKFGGTGLEMALTQFIGNRFYEGTAQDPNSEQAETALEACLADDACLM